MNRKNQKLLLDIVTYVLLSLGAVLMVAPFFWMVATSFKIPANQFSMTLIPNPGTLENYRDLFGVDLNFPLMFFNSTMISSLITIGQLLTCSMAAFAFAVVKFRGRPSMRTILRPSTIPPIVVPFHVHMATR